MLNPYDPLQPAPPSHALRLSLLADDLTGACDAAAAFAARGFLTEVGVAAHATPSPNCEVWSRSSDSRELELPAMEARLVASLAQMPSPRAFFKKIDSVFRGNTFAEIKLLLAARPQSSAILAPAFPQAGRILRKGTMHISELGGARTLSVLESLRAQDMAVAPVPSGLGPMELRTRLHEHARPGRLLLCDAETPQHLNALAVAAQTLPAQPLWIGSAGLAHAVAASWPRVSFPGPLPRREPVRVLPRVLLFFIGSTHAVTRDQVEHLRRSHGASPHVRIVSVPRGEDAAPAVRAAIEGIPTADLGCLFVTGGDTATAVFSALGIESLRLVGEFAPGLPQAVVRGGPFDGMTILTKSGGFGTGPVLCEMVERFGVPAAPATAREGSLV